MDFKFSYQVQDTRGDLLKIGANVNKIHNDVNGLVCYKLEAW